MDRGVVCAHQHASLTHIGTVAILAQGTSWAVAVTQAFLGVGSSPDRDMFRSPYVQIYIYIYMCIYIYNVEGDKRETEKHTHTHTDMHLHMHIQVHVSATLAPATRYLNFQVPNMSVYMY